MKTFDPLTERISSVYTGELPVEDTIRKVFQQRATVRERETERERKREKTFQQ